MAEVEQQGEANLGDGKITGHLGYMGIGKSGDDLAINDHCAVHDEIGHKGADEFSLVVDGEAALLLDHAALFFNSMIKAFS